MHLPESGCSHKGHQFDKLIGSYADTAVIATLGEVQFCLKSQKVGALVIVE
jgi:hypothetical protein